MARLLLVVIALIFGGFANAQEVTEHEEAQDIDVFSGVGENLQHEVQQIHLEYDFESGEAEFNDKFLEELDDMVDENTTKITIRSFGYSELSKPFEARKIALARAVELRNYLKDSGVDDKIISVDLLYNQADQINKVMVYIER